MNVLFMGNLKLISMQLLSRFVEDYRCVVYDERKASNLQGRNVINYMKEKADDEELSKLFATFDFEAVIFFSGALDGAIRVFDEVLKPMGKRPVGIRIDSGDITYLSKKARKMLDDAGYPDCKICVSNSLDEHLIRDMMQQGAKVDSYGVGERLITASSEAVFGGVYKLAAVEKDGEVTPKIKVSENVGKITLPGVKIPWRLYDKNTGKAIADVITLNHEKIDDTKPYEIFDPEHTWKRKLVTDFVAKKLQVKLFEKGDQVYTSPSVKEISNYRASQVDCLWDEVTRFENPHSYYVDLSEDLWNLRQSLLNKLSK